MQNNAFRGNVLPAGEIIKKGAEAVLVKGMWLDQEALYKVRLPKTYRIPQIDAKLRVDRTITEARILGALLEAGIPVPGLLDVDAKGGIIVMEFIHGQRIKDMVSALQGKLGPIFEKVGYLVAAIHELDIIHGDLTTSNIIYESKPDSEDISFTFIDFGLARHSTSIEDKSVDIHLFKRVITSTHASMYNAMFPPFMAGYKRFLEEQGRSTDFIKISRRLEQIESRGRYIEKSERK